MQRGISQKAAVKVSNHTKRLSPVSDNASSLRYCDVGAAAVVADGVVVRSFRRSNHDVRERTERYRAAREPRHRSADV